MTAPVRTTCPERSVARSSEPRQRLTPDQPPERWITGSLRLSPSTPLRDRPPPPRSAPLASVFSAAALPPRRPAALAACGSWLRTAAITTTSDQDLLPAAGVA